jgi:hypothetical protein
MRIKRSIDPSKTVLLRRQFRYAVRKRFAQVRRNLVDFFVENSIELRLASNTVKVELFRKWMKKQIDNNIMNVVGFVDRKPWISTYIESAYKKGLLRSYTDVNKGKVLSNVNWFGGAKAQFLNSMFRRAGVTTHLSFLTNRSFHLLQGAADEMLNKTSLVFSNGVAIEYTPKKMITEISKVINNVSLKRAILITRTEIIHAHAEGQLDGFDVLDVEEVGAEVELNLLNGGEVCKPCKKLEEKIFIIEKARGVIPIHPGCLCAWVLVGEENLLKGVK